MENGTRALKIKMVVKSLPGGSQSRLVLCDDGALYVLKMHPNPQGPNLLANEAIGSFVMSGLDFLVPRRSFISIDLRTLRMFPELAMETPVGRSFPACGVHFASELVGDPGERLIDYLPPTYVDRVVNREDFLGIYLFDLWASHRDQRQCVFRKIRDSMLYDAFVIDNGHLFGGPHWKDVESGPRGACSIFVQPPPVWDSRIEAYVRRFEERVPKLLEQAGAWIPAEWYEGNLDMLFTRLLSRLTTLRTLLSQRIVQTTPDAPLHL